MNKKDFTKYINEQLNGLSLEQQVKELRKVQTEYLTDLINTRKKKLKEWVPEEEKNNYMFCEKCKKYSLKKEFKQELVNEIRTETTYTDAGYGDDDRIGDVEYMVTYITCPLCSHKWEKQKLCIRILRDWNRREGRK